MLLTRSKTFLSLQRSSSPWGVSPSSQASRRSKRSFQGSRGKTTPSRWRYQTRVPRNIDRYVSQFYGYTQVIFKRKVYYRKLQKKALAVRWHTKEQGPERVPVWVVPEGVQLFRTFGRDGQFRWSERLWEFGLFAGVKQWLVRQQFRLSYVLATRGVRAQYWAALLWRLRREHQSSVWLPPSVRLVSERGESFRGKLPMSQLLVVDPQGGPLSLKARRVPLRRVLLAGVLLKNLHASLRHWVFSGPLRSPFLRRSGPGFRGRTRTRNVSRKKPLRGFSRVGQWIGLHRRAVHLFRAFRVRFLHRRQQGEGWGFPSPSEVVETPCALQQYVTWDASVSSSGEERISRARWTSTGFSLRIRKETIWKRKRPVRVVWVVEKTYRDLNLQQLIQQEMVEPAMSWFGTKETVRKFSSKRRLSKQEKAKELAKKRKRTVHGYLLGLPSIRALKNVSLFRKHWLSKRSKWVSMPKGELGYFLAHQFGRLVAGKPTLFVDNVLAHQKDVRRKKKVVRRLKRRSA